MQVPVHDKVENTLKNHAGVHQTWMTDYHFADNERFYELIFDDLVARLKIPSGSVFLDAGCGDGDHSIRLAKRGFRVIGIDFSEQVLKYTEANIAAQGLQEYIHVQNGNLCSLSFEDHSFQYIICWGVLMHIPKVEQAVSELTRVLKPGGILIVEEANMNSFQYLVQRLKNKISPKANERLAMTPAGVEQWVDTPSGLLLARKANIPWLIAEFEKRDLVLLQRVSGQLLELYTRLPAGRLRNAICRLNEFWFSIYGFPRMTYTNLLILQKRSD